jgi:hypothetical protein
LKVLPHPLKNNLVGVKVQGASDAMDYYFTTPLVATISVGRNVL